MSSFSIYEVQALLRVSDALSTATGADLQEALALNGYFQRVCNLYERGDPSARANARMLRKLLSKSTFWNPSWTTPGNQGGR